ncbi:MAG TPA: beta-ketoacyl synthase N-terminal-like domain-containing protein [Bacteroidales bacterium]|nr:beta-ketoacyl synthase N-terminal-like domain-containing protein [Bacteroidales bacterium]
MDSGQNRIAVVGMACRFPGAGNLDEFWEILVNGKDTITHFTDAELEKYEHNFEELRTNPDFVRAKGVLGGIDLFDAEFFGMTPREAVYTDPQHRVWLETAWEALENAGCDPFTYKGSIGVFAGSYINTYILNNILRDKDKLENYIRLRTTESFQIMTGNDAAYIPTRTAYKFNLRGPAVNVQTACSTSLVAISMGCQSLFSYESDVCLAGGICIAVPQESGYLFQEGAIPSPDGKCRPFDANGKGTIFSNGVGIVVMKRYEDAIRDGDRIYALVRGWAMNNDGRNKVSYMAPSVEGQSEAIMMAQAFSEISPEQIGYIEAHGTATQLGDPIELTALDKVFRASTSKKQFCGIGSVKSNIGHTDAASGVASFIKSCLAVYYRTLPPTINYSKPNPQFDFANSPFYVQDKLRKWESPDPLMVGISSFGIGGTNAHVIIEEAPEIVKQDKVEPELPELLLLSAKTEKALDEQKDNLLGYIRNNPGQKLSDIAYTLQSGRARMSYRSFAVASSAEELKKDAFSPSGRSNDGVSSIAFMFSGQGAQYVSMAQDLYRSSHRVRHILDECFSIFKQETGSDLKEVLFGNPGSSENTLRETSMAQPALFAVEYALAMLYEDLGIKPDYLIGHSIGEYAAACVAGVFDMETALKIVIRRGQLMQAMPAGKMMAVRCNMEKLKVLSNGEYEIAAENSESQCTISFSEPYSAAVNEVLKTHGIQALPLNTSHAFHSSAFDPILNSFADYVDSFNLSAPRIPVISCLTGELLNPEQATSGDYWAKQLRNPVLFKKGIQSIAEKCDAIFLEVGPDTHLSGLARQNSSVANKQRVISSLGKKECTDETKKIIGSLGNIWLNGFNINFKVLQKGDRSKVSLPSYPFQRKRYWIDFLPDKTSQQDKPAELPKEITKSSNSFKGENETAFSLRSLLAEMSGYAAEDISEDVSFEKLGFDSLFLTQFAKGIDRKFNVKIEFRQLVSDYSTLRILARFIDTRTISKKQALITLNGPKNGQLNNFVKFQAEGSKDPLIILHGQTADMFIPDYLGRDYPYYGFIHPGSDGEAINFDSVGEMAAAYIDQLVAHKPTGPYFLGGFSFGGVLAFEMALQLTRMGHKVPFVILFDSYARPEPFRWHKSLYKVVKSNLIVPPVMKALKLVKSAVCAGFILAGKPTPVSLRPFYIINKYAKLLETYRPGRYEGKTILFRAVQNGSSLENLGWKDHVSNLEVIPLNAGHLTILKESGCVFTIQSEIKKLLDSTVS